MALFKRKDKKKDIPQLPDLPKLPELPEFPEEELSDEEPPILGRGSGEEDLSSDENIPQLPSFPNGSLGNKFSRDTIKDAVSGKGGIEDDEEILGFELPKREDFMKRGKKKFVKEVEEEQNPFQETEENPFEMSAKPETAEEEPIFVRLDKFEEGSKDFEELRRKVTHIENMFDDVKKVREKEERELELWKSELMNIKEKIEKIDRDIFSKLG